MDRLVQWTGQDWKSLEAAAVMLASNVIVASLILIAAYVVGRFASSAATSALVRTAPGRGATLGPIVRKGVTALALGLGSVMALSQLGIDVAALIAGAGILGLAVGFGAQSMVKDLISGFFLLMEDVVRVGDMAEVSGKTGTIEEVGLRITKLRELSGQLWYIPNGEITTVGNYNRDWSRAVVSVGLAYEQDMARGLAVLQAVGDAYAAENPDQVLEPPQAQGVIGLNESDVGIRLLVKVAPNGLWPVERDLRRLVKERFDAEGIEIPFPRQVVYFRQEGGSALNVAMGESERPAAAESR